MTRLLSFFIGLRFSKAKSRNKLVSFISLSSMIGISLGVMVIIIGLSAMNGFERELRNRILSVIPHGQLIGMEENISAWKQMREDALKYSKVLAAAPYIEFSALLEKGTELKPVQIRGIIPEYEQDVSNILQYVVEEKSKELQDGKSALILGKGIADALDVKEGDWLTAMIPSSNPDLKLRAPKRIRLQVKGILSLGGQVDHGLALITLADAQKYLGIDDEVTGIALKLEDPFHARVILREVGKLLNENVYLNNWTQKFGNLYRDIILIRTIMYLVMVLVIGVACFNIVSTLIMAVKDRASDVAVLRTMGARDGLIRRIFIWQGLLSGVLGSLLGSVLGALISINLTQLITLIEKLINRKFLSGDIYFVNFLPSELHLNDLLIVSSTAIVLSLFATLYPAQRACKLQPAAVLSAK